MWQPGVHISYLNIDIEQIYLSKYHEAQNIKWIPSKNSI